jgi:hypothetical protein
MKKPNADIRGPLIVIPDDRREALVEYIALIKKTPLGSLNLEMIVKMYTWKIAENISLLNRLNKPVNRPHITAKTIKRPTSTWLLDTGADVTFYRKDIISKNPH